MIGITIVATFDTPKSRSKPTGERSARETGDNRERAPADMTYRDWKAVYIDKSKTLAEWRSAKDAKYRADSLTSTAQQGNTGNVSNVMEMQRRRKAQDGHEIIDQPTYNKLTRSFLNAGGLIIRGEEANRHLALTNASASYFAGANAAFIADDATVSDVLEEMYHAYQDRAKMFGEELTPIVHLKREIDAQKYLIRVADRYKIPAEERAVTRANLKRYEKQLEGKLNEQ